MNYLAHGWRFVEDPYLLAGTALPDWLNVSDRGCRVRPKHLGALIDDTDTRVASLARGIAQHHEDDAWFHTTQVFSDLSLELTVALRDRLPADVGFRPSFLGHILVEILLDAELFRRQPDRLDAYYRAMALVEGHLIQEAVNRVATRPAHWLDRLVPRFVEERFLYDYADDGKLWFRLNQVMRRVGLSLLPESLVVFLAEARRLVASQADRLLEPPSTPPILENASEIVPR